MASVCDYREGKVPGLGPQIALDAILACMRSVGTVSIRSFVECLVLKEVVSDEDIANLQKLEEGRF